MILSHGIFERLNRVMTSLPSYNKHKYQYFYLKSYSIIGIKSVLL